MRNYASIALGVFLTLAGCSTPSRVIIPELYRIEQAWDMLEYYEKPSRSCVPQTPKIDKEKDRKARELEWLYKYRRIERPGVYDDNFYA